jgi:hypothetical protein
MSWRREIELKEIHLFLFRWIIRVQSKRHGHGKNSLAAGIRRGNKISNSGLRRDYFQLTQYTCRLLSGLELFIVSRGAAAQRGPGPSHSRGFLITRNDAPQSVGLLWTSDQLVAETSAWQHTTLTTDRHPCPRRDSNSQSQQASGRRPTPLGPAVWNYCWSYSPELKCFGATNPVCCVEVTVFICSVDCIFFMLVCK